MGLYVQPKYEPKKGQGVKSWFKGFYKGYGIPATYELRAPGSSFIKQCNANKHRSVEDHIRLANTYYPGLSTNKILKAIYSILKESRAKLIFCDGANKWVIYRGFSHGTASKYGFNKTIYDYAGYARQYFYTNGRGMYSAYQLYRMFGLTDKDIQSYYTRWIGDRVLAASYQESELLRFKQYMGQ